MLPKLDMPHWKDNEMRGMIKEVSQANEKRIDRRHKKRSHTIHTPLPNKEPNQRRNLDGNAYIPLLNLSKTGILGRLFM